MSALLERALRYFGFRPAASSDPDTHEHQALPAPGDPMWPWPEWPVHRERGQRQPQLRRWSARGGH